jgi:hypothetical protein
MPMIGDAELASLKAEGLRAMPDTVTILRNAPTQTPTGGWRPNWQPHHTTKCRLSASVLSGGNEQEAAGQLAGIMAYTLTVPAGTDITPADRIRVPDGSGPRDFEVAAGKTVASWNMSDSWTLTEVQRG